MANIVLAHGLLGFGSILPTQPWHYFNGIKALYESHGHQVLCPTVPALGSLQARATALEQQIVARWGNSNEPIYALAHSMGGLDCRRVIATTTRLHGRFKRLVTVATPHFGSPVASTVLTPSIFSSFSPSKWVLDLFEDDTGALDDLQSRNHLQDVEAPGVEYLCIGCDAALTLPQSALFTATALIGGLYHVPNDGVVSLASASRNNNPATLWKQWPLDHGGAIGWPSGGIGHEFAQASKTPPLEHIERYRGLLARLIA